MILPHEPLGHHMLLMDSMLAPRPITTVVCISTSQLPNVSASPTHGAYILAIARSLPSLLAAADLVLKQLGRAIPTMTTAKLKHLNTICQLTTVMSGQPNAPPTNPTSQRVVPTTPLRVAIAAPPRVTTTSNTITAPNTIQQSPIVHQRLTRHNNPFQILADDEDDDDTDTVVASNCSPRMPHPTQRPQTIQPTSQPPTTVLTTVRRPPPLCPRKQS